jgi:hypothetical protein
MSAAQLLAETIGAALGVYLYNKFGWGYDGITNANEVKGIEIVLGAVVAGAIGAFMYGGAVNVDSALLYIIEGAAGVSLQKTLASSSMM